jgi:hypothetical protein
MYPNPYTGKTFGREKAAYIPDREWKSLLASFPLASFFSGMRLYG